MFANDVTAPIGGTKAELTSRAARSKRQRAIRTAAWVVERARIRAADSERARPKRAAEPRLVAPAVKDFTNKGRAMGGLLIAGARSPRAPNLNAALDLGMCHGGVHFVRLIRHTRSLSACFRFAVLVSFA